MENEKEYDEEEKQMTKDHYAVDYGPLLKTFVAEYQAAPLQQNTSPMVEQTFHQMNILPDASEYWKKRFMDDVLDSITPLDWKRKFVKEFFLVQFKGIELHKHTKEYLQVLYLPTSKYLAKAAFDLGSYEFVLEFILRVFTRVSSSAPDILIRDESMAHIEEDYDELYEQKKYQSAEIIAVELSDYVTLLDESAADQLSLQARVQFLQLFAPFLYEAKGILHDLKANSELK